MELHLIGEKLGFDNFLVVGWDDPRDPRLVFIFLIFVQVDTLLTSTILEENKGHTTLSTTIGQVRKVRWVGEMMVEPTEEEIHLIRQLRNKVEDVLKNDEHRSDFFLLRWLRARDGHLDKAEEMLRKSFEWREENDVDSVLQKPLDPFIKANYPYSLSGRDLDGRPVFQVELGDWDIRKAIDEGKEEEFLHLVNYILEEIVQAIRESNKDRPKGAVPHTQFTYLVNWEGYSYAQLLHWKAVQHLLKFGAQYEAHYPEIMYRAIFINCPAIFPMFLSLLKTILAPKTLAKIEMFGSDKEQWEQALDLLVADNERGENFGGSLYHL